jgi:hypothetical protein
MFGNKNNNILQFGIILNNEAIMLKNFIQIFCMARIYIYIPELSTIPIFV